MIAWIAALGIRLLCFGPLVLFCLGSSQASAQAGLRIHWDSCQSQGLVKSFAGSGPYQQIVTLRDFAETNIGHEIVVALFFRDDIGCPTPFVPDAWRFDEGGCQVGRLTASPSSSDPACPTMGGANRQSSVLYHAESGIAYLRLRTTYDPFTPSADSVYALWTITYDHSMSVIGPSKAGMCGGVEGKACIQLQGGAWFRPDSSEGGLQGGWAVMWQGSDACDFCDPAQSATWGAIKSRYR